MVKKLEGLVKDGIDLSPNDRAVLSLTWKYFVWGALGGALLAIVWNRSLDFWTVIGGGIFGVVIVVGLLVAVACDVIQIRKGGD